jgi:hypothetical protein
MAYRWPMTNASGVLQEALEIATAYLEYTGQAARVSEVESLCAAVILAAWRSGIRHRIKLADCAINAVEAPAEDGVLPSFPLGVARRQQ